MTTEVANSNGAATEVAAPLQPDWQRLIPLAAEGDANPIPDEENDEYQSPETVRTTIPLARNPYLKGLVLLTAISLAAAVGWVAFESLFTLDAPSSTVAEETSPFASPLPGSERDRAGDGGPSLEAEVAELRAKDALGTQERELAALEEPNNAPTPPAEASTEASKAPTPTPQSMPRAPVARPLAPVRPAPLPRSAAPAPRPASPERTAVPPVDPLVAWQQASAMGSYGSLVPIAPVEPTEPEGVAAATDGLPQPLTRAASASGGATAASSEILAAATIAESEPSLQFAAGETAAAELTISLQWTSSTTELAYEKTLQLQLEEDLLAADGTVGIPEGARLVARLVAANEEGFVRIAPERFILLDGSERVIPEGALLLQGKKGSLLQAKRKTQGSSGNFNLGRTLLAGAREGADLLNAETTTSTNFSVTQGIEDPNIAAGVASGIAGEALDEFQNRSQSQRSSRRIEIFSIKEGAEVELYVNESFSL